MSIVLRNNSILLVQDSCYDIAVSCFPFTITIILCSSFIQLHRLVSFHIALAYNTNNIPMLKTKVILGEL